ncbi:hypothetical protein ACFQ7I_08980 [Streptomyces massasporeus]
MNTPSPLTRARRLGAAAILLAVVTVAVGVLVWAVGMGVPDAWWPDTGLAFAADSPRTRDDACAKVSGSGQTRCKSGATTAAAAAHHRPEVAWGLATAAAGLGALMVWRRQRAGAVEARRG